MLLGEVCERADAMGGMGEERGVAELWDEWSGVKGCVVVGEGACGGAKV